MTAPGYRLCTNYRLGASARAIRSRETKTRARRDAALHAQNRLGASAKAVARRPLSKALFFVFCFGVQTAYYTCIQYYIAVPQRLRRHNKSRVVITVVMTTAILGPK